MTHRATRESMNIAWLALLVTVACGARGVRVRREVKVTILGVAAVVRNAGIRAFLVAALVYIEPAVTPLKMLSDSEPQPMLQRCLVPEPDNVLLRTPVRRVLRVMLRIPTIEVVVIYGECDKIPGPSALVAFYQVFGIEMFRLP